MIPAVLLLVGNQLILQANGATISAIQWNGDGQSSAVATKTLTCNSQVPRCLLAGLNQSPIPDGPIAEGVTMASMPVASAPNGTSVPVVVLVPPESLRVK